MNTFLTMLVTLQLDEFQKQLKWIQVFFFFYFFSTFKLFLIPWLDSVLILTLTLFSFFQYVCFYCLSVHGYDLCAMGRH